MNKRLGFLVSLLLGVMLTLGMMHDVEAKRFGGGASFGSRASYGTPFKREGSAPAMSPLHQQESMARNQSMRSSLGLRGGLTGMLGRFAIGGMLGALFFGGAFEHINLMDMLIFGGVIFLLFRVLAISRRASPPRAAYQPQPRPVDNRYARVLESQNLVGRGPGNGLPPGDGDVRRPSLPVAFDQAGFIAGAKNAYGDLQKAWDARDLGIVRRLTTEGMYVEVAARIQDLDADNHTTVLRLEAELLQVSETDDRLEAVVHFDALVQECEGEPARRVHEVWNFIRHRGAVEPTWFLDGIRQTED